MGSWIWHRWLHPFSRSLDCMVSWIGQWITWGPELGSWVGQCAILWSLNWTVQGSNRCNFESCMNQWWLNKHVLWKEVEFYVRKHVVCEGYCVLRYGAMKPASYHSFGRTFSLYCLESGGNRFPRNVWQLGVRPYAEHGRSRIIWCFASWLPDGLVPCRRRQQCAWSPMRKSSVTGGTQWPVCCGELSRALRFKWRPVWTGATAVTRTAVRLVSFLACPNRGIAGIIIPIA
jgi:hypothetical protein